MGEPGTKWMLKSGTHGGSCRSCGLEAMGKMMLKEVDVRDKRVGNTMRKS